MYVYIYICMYVYIYIYSKIKAKYLHELTETLASFYFSHVIPRTYLEPIRKSMMDLFCKNF